MTTMTQWGSQNFRNKGIANVTFDDVLQEFPSKLKQAMFAAASTRTIARGTWNGCAFNAAGMEVGKSGSVRSLSSAAAAFGVSTAIVQQFITRWDKMTGSDQECTQRLRFALEKAGLFSEPGDKPPRIIKQKVFENQQKKLREQFDSLMEANMIEGTDLMEELLCSSV